MRKVLRQVLTALLLLSLCSGVLYVSEITGRCFRSGERLLKCCRASAGAHAHWLLDFWRAIPQLLAGWLTTPARFHPQACANLRAAFDAKISGQDETLSALHSALCAHVRDQQSYAPLVLLLTGPPGVGKSWTTRVTAQGLYRHGAHRRLKCNPEDAASCPAFVVFSGMNYVADQEAAAFDRLLGKLRNHTSRFREALVVIEQFDHLSCTLRDRFRDVLDQPSAYDVHLERSVVMVVSNVGTDATLKLSTELKLKHRDADIVANEVKRFVFDDWKTKCVTGDTPEAAQQQLVANERLLKQVNHILPFWLLTKADIRRLFHMLLQQESGSSQRLALSGPSTAKLQLQWSDQLLDFLVSKYEFNSDFAVDGGSRCADVVRQHVLARLVDVRCQPGANALHVTYSKARGVEWTCSSSDLVWKEL